MKNLVKFFILLIFVSCSAFAAEYLYILDDKCIRDLFFEAEKHFLNTAVEPIKDSRGLILRYLFDDPLQEYLIPNTEVYKKIENFLAKMENPVIIEVHTGEFPNGELANIKKWEFSTIMANAVEVIISEPAGVIERDRINSIWYGEFLPAKNTSNNGGKNTNRIDIIILCNIIGE